MKLISHNRKARHLYEVLDTLESGLELTGTEVKSLRDHRVNLTDAFARAEGGEMWLYQMQISPYHSGNIHNHEPKRPRRLLLHKREIVRWGSQAEQKGLTIIPLRIYLNKRNRIKVELALVKPKKVYDRRREIRERDIHREMERSIQDRF